MTVRSSARRRHVQRKRANKITRTNVERSVQSMGRARRSGKKRRDHRGRYV